MLISYNWLQSYFEEKLPTPEKLAELITFGFAEVESVDKLVNRDAVLDVKVLPDRACYALSHRGVAYEVAAITGFKKKTVEWPQPEIKKVRAFSVRVEAQDLCTRYMSRVIENVTSKEQAWVKEHLEAVGQRSINPVVDGANLVMFDRGQPLHAFDADRVKGGIVVRRAKKGEKITTLDNREVNLDESVLVIADEEAPLAIAGIKGGKRAEVTASTRNLILEAASFDASYIRKASERLGIKTEASKRFENRLSPSLAGVGMNDFSAYLFEMDKNISVGEIVDTSSHRSDVLENIRITPGYICEKLGFTIKEADIEKVLSSLSIAVKKEKGSWLLTPPAFRVDLAIPEDIAEEVGRLVGYDKIPVELPPKSKDSSVISKEFYYEWKLREHLAREGFSEIMTSSFSEKGSVAILKPLAEDKRYVRPDLLTSFAPALVMNTLNAPLLGGGEVRIFEIGRVFPTEGVSERTALCIGVAKNSGGKGESINKKIRAVRDNLVNFLGAPVISVCTVDDTGGIILLSGKPIGTINVVDGVLEMNLDELIESLPKPKMWNSVIPPIQNEKYQPISVYPFIVRDVALFVPTGTESDIVHKLILKEAGNFVVRSWLFDRFEKGDKISYAFRIVFQSHQRTLTDEEANEIMNRVSAILSEKGWQVR